MLWIMRGVAALYSGNFSRHGAEHCMLRGVEWSGFVCGYCRTIIMRRAGERVCEIVWLLQIGFNQLADRCDPDDAVGC